MPTDSKVHDSRVQRRVSTCQRSLTRPVASIPTAKAKGTVNPTNPRYSSGGWMATSGLSWSSELGPAPWSGAVPGTVRNGLAGKAMSPKKKAETAYITRVTQRMTGSAAWRR